MSFINISILTTCLIATITVSAQRQYADTLYQAPNTQPEYEVNTGPKVAIDAGHNNFHTSEDRYKPFANVLKQDGYQVISYQGDFNSESLKDIKILVISNALHESNVGGWKRPNPSAFSAVEINNLNEWVKKGGKLFLIADHMPFAGASQRLAKSFGYEFLNGFASDSTKTGSDLFYRSNGSLMASEITEGKNESEWIDSIRSFTGQAFQIPDKAVGILKCDATWLSFQPEIPWQFDESTEVVSVADWYQGAYQFEGNGKLAVFGEAAMFTAQIIEMEDQTFNAGMNRENAKYNYRLLLNIIHWLDK